MQVDAKWFSVSFSSNGSVEYDMDDGISMDGYSNKIIQPLVLYPTEIFW